MSLFHSLTGLFSGSPATAPAIDDPGLQIAAQTCFVEPDFIMPEGDPLSKLDAGQRETIEKAVAEFGKAQAEMDKASAGARREQEVLAAKEAAEKRIEVSKAASDLENRMEFQQIDHQGDIFSLPRRWSSSLPVGIAEEQGAGRVDLSLVPYASSLPPAPYVFDLPSTPYASLPSAPYTSEFDSLYSSLAVPQHYMPHLPTTVIEPTAPPAFPESYDLNSLYPPITPAINYVPIRPIRNYEPVVPSEAPKKGWITGYFKSPAYSTALQTLLESANPKARVQGAELEEQAEAQHSDSQDDGVTRSQSIPQTVNKLGVRFSHKALVAFVKEVRETLPPEAPLKERLALFHQAVKSVLSAGGVKKTEQFRGSLEQELRGMFFWQVITEEAQKALTMFLDTDQNPDHIIVPFMQAKQELTLLQLGQKDGIREGISCDPEQYFYKSVFQFAHYELLEPLRQLRLAYQESLAQKSIEDESLRTGQPPSTAPGAWPVEQLIQTYERRWQQFARAYEILAGDLFIFNQGFSQGKPISFEEAVAIRRTEQEREFSASAASSSISSKTDSVAREALSEGKAQASHPAIKTDKDSQAGVEDVTPKEEESPKSERNYQSYVDVRMKGKTAFVHKKGDSWFEQLPMGIQYRIYKLYLRDSSSPWAKAYEKYRDKHFRKRDESNKIFDIEETYAKPMRASHKNPQVVKAVRNMLATIESEGSDADLMFWINKIPKSFFKDKILLGYVREQALAEGVQIQDWNKDWAKHHYKDDLRTLSQAILRWYDRCISDYANKINSKKK